MLKAVLQRSKIYSNSIRAMDFLKKMGLRPHHFAVPALLALGATLFEGISLSLLIPAIKGMIERDFGFVRDVSVLGRFFVKLFPLELSHRNSTLFVFVVSLIFIAAIAKNILHYLSSISVAYQGRRVASNLRKLIYDRYLSFGKLFFDQHNIGHLHQILIAYTFQIAQQLHNIHNAFCQFFTLFIYLAIMFSISWPLTIFVLIVFPVLHFSLGRLLQKIKKASEVYVESYSELGKKISNALTCIPLVKAYTNEKKEKEWFAQTNNLVQQLEFSIDKKWIMVSPLQEIIMLCVFLLLVGAMSFLLVWRRSGDLAAFVVFLLVFRRSIAAFGFFNQIQSALAVMHGPILEVMKILDDKDKYFEVEGKKEFTGLKHAIEFRHLNFFYPKGIQALKDVTLSLEDRKMTAIVGPSGAGKTTLIHLIMRFYDCPAGTLKIDGVDIKDFSLKSLRAKMALVSQEPLLVNAPLRMNLTYGMNGEILNGDLVDAVQKARLYDFIMQLPRGFETEVGDRGIKLAGGEKQRVAIARAILKNPEILLLDEATSSLDSQTEHLIQNALDELVKDKTTIVIAHRLSTIKHAAKIIVMENGQLVEQGTLEELISTKGKFCEYWEAQRFY